MFGIAPEEAAIERLRRLYGWQPPSPEDLNYGDDEYDHDIRWEEVVARWERDDHPEIEIKEPEGDDQ